MGDHLIIANPVSCMPNWYRPPLGLPLRWQDEQSGELPAAIMAYFHHKEQPMLRLQIKLVLDYLRYYIHAPCWMYDPPEELAELRSRVETLSTEEEIDAWIQDCLEIGIDPL